MKVEAGGSALRTLTPLYEALYAPKRVQDLPSPLSRTKKNFPNSRQPCLISSAALEI